LQHLENYSSPRLQKHIIRILFMPPVYAIDCFGPGPPGTLSGLSVLPSKSALYDVFVWARGALNSEKWRFLSRAVAMRFNSLGAYLTIGREFYEAFCGLPRRLSRLFWICVVGRRVSGDTLPLRSRCPQLPLTRFRTAA
jgi:hypothetical protein